MENNVVIETDSNGYVGYLVELATQPRNNTVFIEFKVVTNINNVAIYIPNYVSNVSTKQLVIPISIWNRTSSGSVIIDFKLHYVRDDGTSVTKKISGVQFNYLENKIIDLITGETTEKTIDKGINHCEFNFVLGHKSLNNQVFIKPTIVENKDNIGINFPTLLTVDENLNLSYMVSIYNNLKDGDIKFNLTFVYINDEETGNRTSESKIIENFVIHYASCEPTIICREKEINIIGDQGVFSFESSLTNVSNLSIICKKIGQGKESICVSENITIEQGQESFNLPITIINTQDVGLVKFDLIFSYTNPDTGLISQVKIENLSIRYTDTITFPMCDDHELYDKLCNTKNELYDILVTFDENLPINWDLPYKYFINLEFYTPTCQILENFNFEDGTSPEKESKWPFN